MALVLITGIPMTTWGFWMRLGRSASARSWSTGRSPARQLFLYPFFGAALVLSGVGTLVQRVAVLSDLLLTAAVVAVLISLVFGLLAVPAPGFLKPRWYRGLERRPSAKRGERTTVPPVPAAPAVDGAWVPVCEALRADVAALEPSDCVELAGDPQRFIVIWHDGDALAVECAGSQAWGGPASISVDQEGALQALGLTTPFQRRHELSPGSSFRAYVPIDDQERAASRAAEVAVAALAILGVNPGADLKRTVS